MSEKSENENGGEGLNSRTIRQTRDSLSDQHLPSRLMYRNARKEDGGHVWSLIRRSGGLDLNSPYCYIMLCDLFADTCAVAEMKLESSSANELVGFVSAYVKPKEPETLFIWQIAVDSRCRKQGIAADLIRHLLKQPACRAIRFLELTISPSNMASQALFKRVAAELQSPITETPGYPEELFPGDDHEAEMLYRIGPFSVHRSIE